MIARSTLAGIVLLAITVATGVAVVAFGFAGLGQQSAVFYYPGETPPPPTETPVPLARMEVFAPAEPQPIGFPFEVTVAITRADVVWAGYDMNLSYDTSIVRVLNVTDGDIADCNPPNSWFNSQQAPTVRTGCAFQESTETGITERIEFECVSEGASVLHFVRPGEHPAETHLFDPQAEMIPTEFVDGSVTCGVPPPTHTPTATPVPLAEMVVSAPDGAQAIGAPFEVEVAITRADAVWAGYQIYLEYDSSVLLAHSIAPGGVGDPGCTGIPTLWGGHLRSPGVITSGCFAQASTATGVSDIIVFECIDQGTSELDLVAVRRITVPIIYGLFDYNAEPIPTEMIDGSVTCAPGASATPTPYVPTNTPTPTATPPPGSLAEMAVSGPAGEQVIAVPFEVTVAITRADVVWGGYNLQLVYDRSILLVRSVMDGDVGLCDPPSAWRNFTQTPTIRTGCAFQVSNDTGISERIEFECIANGTSILHLTSLAEAPGIGTALFDVYAITIPTDLIDSTVTCGAGGPTSTPTPNPPTHTPTPTVTPTPSPAAGVAGCFGDVNGDGRVTGKDVGAVHQAMKRSSASADLNGDGVVNGQDLKLVLDALQAGVC